MLTIEIQVLLVLALALVLLVLSILDFALSGLNKLALRRISESSGTRAGSALVKSLAGARSELLMAVHISIQIFLIAIAVLLAHAFLGGAARPWLAMAAATGATLLLVLIFRQLLPRAIALRNPEAVLNRLMPALVVPYFLLGPLVGLIMWILNKFHRWEVIEPEEEDASDEEIQAFIDAGQEEGILEQDEGAMIQSIVQFGDKVALEVMTPRTQIVAVDIKESVEGVIDLVVRSRHSRILVYRDEMDNPEGIVHARDLLRLARQTELPDSVRALLRPVQFVPETKPLDDLLEEMKAEGQQLVLVVDEYGGVSGLITIEDLIEEIVGDIHDGFSEPDAAKVLEESPGTYLVPGGKELSAVDALLGTNVFPDTECTTVGGAVVELFGRLPSPGERIRHDGVAIEIVAADRRKVRRLRIQQLSPQPRSEIGHG